MKKKKKKKKKKKGLTTPHYEKETCYEMPNRAVKSGPL
jgi:hypothetical protein